jgi:Xaa-Pro dipeptidase
MENRFNLSQEQLTLMSSEYPRFSEAEYRRRHESLARVMAAAEVDHLLVVTDHRAGNGPQWVTGWPGTVEAYVIFKPGEKMTMYMEWYNHIPLAQRIAGGVDVLWGAHRGIEQTIDDLKRRGARRVGVMGPLVAAKWRALEQDFAVVGLDDAYIRLRMVKSEEELSWLRIGAALSDAGFASLLANTRVGLSERELAALVESAYISEGGTTQIHFIGVTSMPRPHLCVPPQLHSSRKVQSADVVFCELSAYWWDYPGQVLRTFYVDSEPTKLYRELHETAEAAFDAVTAVVRDGATPEELVRAAGVIEQRGFSVWDDLVHGYGGGYLPPVLGTASRPAGPLPSFRLEENMVIVVQPNVVTADHSAGVQVGEMVRVTKTGFERLHRAPRGFFKAGHAI